MSILKTVEVVSLNQEIVDIIEDIHGNNIYIVAETCDSVADEDLEILLKNYPLHGCENCGYTADRAIKDCSKDGNFRCQNCSNFNYFLFNY